MAKAVNWTGTDAEARKRGEQIGDKGPRDREIDMADTGGAWLSSARVVRCWVKSRNERNPCR